MHMTNKILRPQKILHLSSHPPPYSFEKLFVSYEFLVDGRRKENLVSNLDVLICLTCAALLIEQLFSSKSGRQRSFVIFLKCIWHLLVQTPKPVIFY